MYRSIINHIHVHCYKVTTILLFENININQRHLILIFSPRAYQLEPPFEHRIFKLWKIKLK